MTLEDAMHEVGNNPIFDFVEVEQWPLVATNLVIIDELKGLKEELLESKITNVNIQNKIDEVISELGIMSDNQK